MGTSLAFTTRHFAITNVVFIVVWLGVTFTISRNDFVPAHALPARSE